MRIFSPTQQRVDRSVKLLLRSLTRRRLSAGLEMRKRMYSGIHLYYNSRKLVSVPECFVSYEYRNEIRHQTMKIKVIVSGSHLGNEDEAQKCTDRKSVV